MEELRIDLSSPSGVFFPGQLVAGNVNIRLKDSIKARYVSVSIIGKAKTKWVVYKSRTDFDGKNHRYVNVTYSDEIIYVDEEINVWTSTEECKKISAGQHQFPFAFNLPINVAPTFEGKHGFIRYYIHVKIDRPWSFDDSCKVPFTVTPHFDLNSVHYACLPAVKLINKNLGFFLFNHGRLNIKATLPKVGYVAGESIILQLDIDNASSRDVTKVEGSLIQCAAYTAKKNGGRFTFGFRPTEEKRERCINVTCFKEHFKVSKNSKGTHTVTFPIPPTSPSFNMCPIIAVSYYLKIKITTSGTFSDSLSCQIPLLIGTIPIRATTTGQSVDFPANIAPPMPSAPPSYENSQITYGTCQFGDKNTDDQDERIPDYAPKYIYYPNLSLN